MDLNEQEAQDYWNSLDSEDAKTPEPVKQEAADPPAATPAAEPPPADDPLEGFSPRAKEYIVGQQQQVRQLLEANEALAARLRNAEGHIGGLKSRFDQVQTPTKEPTRQPTNEEIRDAAKSPEAFARLKDDYPEIAEGVSQAIEHALKARPNGPAVDLDAVTERIRNELRQEQDQRIAEINRRMAFDRIETAHSGWQDTVRSPEFQGWKASQPREVLALGDSSDPADAIRMLDLFRDSRTKPNQRPSPAAGIPSTRATGNRRVKSEDEMTPEEYWAYLDSQGK